jgi:hypothetical protein
VSQENAGATPPLPTLHSLFMYGNFKCLSITKILSFHRSAFIGIWSEEQSFDNSFRKIGCMLPE